MNANFKKQLQRVTQRLDQTLGRSEKSEVLSEEQQGVERRVDLIQKICQNVSKRLLTCLTNQTQPCDAEKRLKKIPKAALSHSCIESAVQLGSETWSGQAFQVCGDAEGAVAMEILQMEVEVEDRVLRPLNELLEVDIPSIQKLRKQLSSKTLDMDAARARYSALFRQTQQGASVVQSKIEAARDEVEDCVAKVEQTRDQLETEMYAFIAKESVLSHSLYDLVEIEVLYHQHALEVLQKIKPQLQECKENSYVKPVFGVDLSEHLSHTGRRISVVIEDCITALCSHEYEGLKEEGLFRIAGGTSKMKKLRAAFNAEHAVITPEEYSSHVISSVLKQYLRELPDPLLTFKLYSEWTEALQSPSEQRLPVIRKVISKLPAANRENLQYLIKFLAKLSDHSDVNKMSASNIALVVGPNLLWAAGDPSANVMATSLPSSLTEILISNCDYFFSNGADNSVAGVSDRSNTYHSPGSHRVSTDKVRPQVANKQSVMLTKTCSDIDNRQVSRHSSSSSDTTRQERPRGPLPERPNVPPPLPEKPTAPDKPARDRTEKPPVSKRPLSESVSSWTASVQSDTYELHSHQGRQPPGNAIKPPKPPLPRNRPSEDDSSRR